MDTLSTNDNLNYFSHADIDSKLGVVFGPEDKLRVRSIRNTSLIIELIK